MDPQATLWLYSLIFIAVFSLALYIKMGLSWTWGFCLQASVLLAVGLLGLYTHLHFLCASTGWALFVLFFAIPRSIMSRLERHLSMLNLDAAVSDADKLRWFFWGPPGRYWPDVARSMRSYLQGDAKTAEALFEKWQSARLPKQTRDNLSGYIMTGRVFLRDWQGIIDEFEKLRARKGTHVNTSVASAASRAFLELGRVDEAAECLETANLATFRLSEYAREVSFVAFFSLSGAERELTAVLKSAPRKKPILPAYAEFYWLARCRQAQGKIEECRQLLTKALAAVPPKLSAWRDRVAFQLERLAGAPDTMPGADWSAAIARGRKVLENARLAKDIASPKHSCPTVTILVALIIAVYLASHSFEFWRSNETIKLSEQFFIDGRLSRPDALAGQYWRYVSFLFLHAHISHVVLNLIGLWWFGRMAENLFGTPWFLAIYFGSGIASGVSEIAFSQSMDAVGASGSIMGVFGASAAAIFRLKDLLPRQLRKNELSWMLGLAVAQTLLDRIFPNVAIYAHLGGLVTGFLLGLVLPLRKDELITASRLSTEVA